MAGRALRPIRQMADQAREITSESLGKRLPNPNPHDELGQLATVFNETLQRLESSFEAHSRAEGGAGLGLALAKLFVEQNGGSIGLASKPGPGSRFQIRLSLPEAAVS